MSQSPRLPGLDALKGLACVLIVWHHLAFYGPMSDVVYPFAPGLVDWLFDHGRMAVQVFLVAGGFLAAAALAPEGSAAFAGPGRLVLRRYVRLMGPALVALAVSVLVAALVRPWFHHDSVPAAPTLLQLLAHLLLLQDLLGQPALSAGLWYVAIDFQLFAISVLLLWAARAVAPRLPGRPAMWGRGLVLALTLGSLLLFNRQPGMDVTGLYFFGAYGLGMLAFWGARAEGRSRTVWWWAIAALGALALALDFRERLLVAVLTALGLLWLANARPDAVPARWLQQRWLVQLGKLSYPVFLIHFPVCLLVNAVVSHFWPVGLLANALGLMAAFGLSLLAGAALARAVGVQPLRLRAGPEPAPVAE